jgi:ABC-type sugar transport system substrate-binding protein
MKLKGILATLFLLGMASAAFAEQGRPPSISEADWGHIKNLIDPDVVQWNPYKGLAVKQDGTPYRVLYLPVWMGDDYQVVAQHLAKYQLEQAGAKFTVVSAEFDAQKQIHALEDAVATHAYDAVIIQPMDPGSIATTIDKAISAGIDVYDWVIPAKTDKLTGFAGYIADAIDANGQIGKVFAKEAQTAGATADKPYRILEIWGIRAAPICQDRHNGMMKGIGANAAVQVVESVDTAGQPEAEVKAIQDAFARYPDIKAIYPQFGDAGAIIEGLRSVGRLAPKGDPKHVAVILQDIDKAMLAPLKDGTFDYTISNNPWHQIDVVLKQFMWHTVLKQPLADAASGDAKMPRWVQLPMPLMSGETIDTSAAHMWGGTIAFTEMPLGKWEQWPVLDTSKIGLSTPTMADRMRLLKY